MKVRILTIDDDLVVIATLKNMINGIFEKDDVVDLTMDVSTTKAEAIEKLEASLISEEYYDLVFLDLTLENLNDGFDLVPVFKTHSPNSHIVIITGSPHISLLRKAKELKVDGFVKKPMTAAVHKLQEIVSRTARLKMLEQEFKDLAFDNE